MITSTILDIITILSFGVSIFALIITINIYLIQQQRSDDAILENLTVEFLTEFIINFKRLNLELGNLVRRKEIGTTDDLLKRIKKYPLNWNFTYWLSHRGIILGILLKKGKGIEEFRSVLLFTKEAAAFKKNIEEMNQKIGSSLNHGDYDKKILENQGLRRCFNPIWLKKVHANANLTNERSKKIRIMELLQSNARSPDGDGWGSERPY